MTSTEPAAICVDWGTTSFRAYLANADGTIADRVETGRGILAIAKGEHEAALEAAVGGWRSGAGAIPIVMSGMIGARQGWIEAPYARCPAGIEEIAAAMATIETATLGPVGLVPGVCAFAADGAPDVMRGEETQILGALAGLGRADALFVLPGTHSKWARVEAGRIVGFTTYMTGEAFAALKDHTILGRLMEGSEPDRAGFAEGVRAAGRLTHAGDLLHAIFMTRSLGLFDRLAPKQLSDYLSGLLIGAEIAAGAIDASSAVVIGSPALTARYCAAGEILGVSLVAAPDDCAPAGLLALLPHWLPRVTRSP